MGVHDMAKWEVNNCKDKDMVNHPPHYNKYGVECIEAIQSATGEGYEYYLQGNIIKYLWRYRYKNGVQDLEKAQWYLDKLIKIKKDSLDKELLDFSIELGDGC
tara:strand:+ start:3290 stop:3598 length:309 start_codon:yes stop_codon:yes gene_type:complete